MMIMMMMVVVVEVVVVVVVVIIIKVSVASNHIKMGVESTHKTLYIKYTSDNGQLPT
jgi:hypothetical protein